MVWLEQRTQIRFSMLHGERHRSKDSLCEEKKKGGDGDHWEARRASILNAKKIEEDRAKVWSEENLRKKRGLLKKGGGNGRHHFFSSEFV